MNPAPKCPQCNRDSRVTPSRFRSKTWWCDRCTIHFDDHGERVSIQQVARDRINEIRTLQADTES